MTDAKYVITIDDIRAAAERIAGFVVRTPTVLCERISKQLGCQVHFKAENLQHVSAFKSRGATNAVMSLSEEEAARGVVTHSSGNHAAALSRAAALRSIPAYVVMPRDSSPNKIAAVRSFGVEPVFCEPDSDARAAAAERVRQKTGATMIHPYDDPVVMAGQGTVGLEIIEQLPSVDAIFLPVGGGGLLSGVLVAVKAIKPEVAVIAVEPELADDTARSLESGQLLMPTRYDTVADGLRTALGENTFPIIRSLLDDIVLVSEESIKRETRRIAEHAKLVAEPSGAVSLAGLVKVADRFQGKTVAVVISGGNIEFGDCKLGR